MSIRITPQVAQLGTESAFEVLARARRMENLGREVLHLELGEPDFPTPPHIMEAGLRALGNGATKYAPAAGIPELRDAVAACAQTRGLTVSAENVLVTSGSKPMLYYALLALVHPGDEVLVPDPGFPIYESVVRFAGGVPVRYGVNPEGFESIDLEEIRALISPKTRVLVLNTPHNPTGAVLNLGTAIALADLVHRHDLTVVSDEIYSRLVFGGWQGSIAALPEMTARTVVVDGFSKAYAMTGWRLGYGIAPVELIRRLERFVVNTTTCAPPFVQRAGLAALTGPQDSVEGMRAEFCIRRDLLVTGLDQMDGVSCAMPRGAFYAFPRISEWLEELKLTTELFAEVLLQEFGLACLPGTAFGPGGAEHLRLSFATSQATLRCAVELLRKAATPSSRRAIRMSGSCSAGSHPSTRSSAPRSTSRRRWVTTSPPRGSTPKRPLLGGRGQFGFSPRCVYWLNRGRAVGPMLRWHLVW